MRSLKAVKSLPGRPLYLTVRDAVCQAIEAGVFQPGRRMPSTKNLSEQLNVSLVTAHRALHGLVATGVLQRSQGRGTFVHQNYRDRRSANTVRLGLTVPPGASLTNYFHSHLLEGIRQAAEQVSADLLLLSTTEDIRDECDGLLFISPSTEQIETFLSIARRKPALMVGATTHWPQIASVDVSGFESAKQVLLHLRQLGHRRIGYVGKYDNLCMGRDQWDGFLLASQQMQIMPLEQHVVRGMSWKLDEREKLALMRFLTSPSRPSAIFASGIELALDVYKAAADAGLRIPQDLSIVGVDDPPSGPHWSPPITTIRKPLTKMSQAAVSMLFKLIQHSDVVPPSQTLPSELIVRGSTTACTHP
jgi:DNA-binding LacI/PurR family transcriptional regulator